jgi:phage baseplate assembly protein W
MSLKQDYIENNPSRVFKDINIAFTRHPITKDLSVKVGDASIKQALRNLVLLNRNDKPFHPEIGGGVYDMLFENYDEPGNTESLRQRLAALINKHEPRVDLTRIDIEPRIESNALSISLYYVILNTLEPSNVDIFLKITR